MTEKEFIITVSHELTRELSESFQNGPIIDDNGCRFLTEELVANLNGLKIQIFRENIHLRIFALNMLVKPLTIRLRIAINLMAD